MPINTTAAQGVYTFPETEIVGYTVSGTATSFNSDTDEVIIQLTESGAAEPAYEAIVKGNSASYSIADVPAGTYTMKVMKQNHVTREYTVTVGMENVAQDVEIWLLGDVNGDGTINVKDKKLIFNHLNDPSGALTGYALDVGEMCIRDRYEDIEGTGKRRTIWLFRCDCGTEKEIPATQVKHSRTRSCGCLANEHITLSLIHT